MALLEVSGLSKSYPAGGGFAGFGERNRPVVEDVSFKIVRGETLGLVGESGSGKSTVARMILGLIRPDAGSVIFDGTPIVSASSRQMRLLRRRMQPVFQDPFAALNPRMRIRDIVTEPLSIHNHDAGLAPPTGSARERRALHAHELLRAVGLDDSALLRYPHEFSGGQRQRINIARALALRPELLILDEPVSALDVSVGAQIVNLLRNLQRDFSLTYLFISHSMPLVRYLSANIAVMRAGRLVEIGSSDDVCRRPREDYTRALLAATPGIRHSATD
ncbi:MAG TPA: ATP-binding cassette domain-containing protein [Acidisarcina sp.]